MILLKIYHGKWHIEKHYGNKKFTAKAENWELFLVLPFDKINLAQKAERYTKSMHSSKYIGNLKNDERYCLGLFDKGK